MYLSLRIFKYSSSLNLHSNKTSEQYSAFQSGLAPFSRIALWILKKMYLINPILFENIKFITGWKKMR